jgi:hypothetical protein
MFSSHVKGLCITGLIKFLINSKFYSENWLPRGSEDHQRRFNAAVHPRRSHPQETEPRPHRPVPRNDLGIETPSRVCFVFFWSWGNTKRERDAVEEV